MKALWKSRVESREVEGLSHRASRAFFGLRPSTLVPRRSAFVLFEVMLGMAIFAIGVVALGECVNNCINAQVMKNDDQRARLALENRMGQIESGEISLTSAKTDTLTGMFDGITLKQSRTALNEKNEKNEPLGGLWSVSLEASWKRGNQEQSKSLSFYVFSLK